VTASSTAQALETVEVVSGKLHVRVFSHVIASASGPVPCWTYVSDGLRGAGQKEILFSVKREAGEAEAAFPRELLGLYATLHRFAHEGKVVEAGGVTRLGPSGPGFLREDLRGILYIAGQAIAGVPIERPFLTAIICSGAECDVASRLGHVRLLSLIGRHYAYFPTAPWLDRRRAELVRPEAMASSVLNNVRTMVAPTAAARMEAGGGAGSRIVLKLRRAKASALDAALAQIPPAQAVALLVGLDPRCDAALVWSAGQREPSAISAAGSKGERIAGNFVLLVPGVAEDGARILEDGFSVMMTASTWERFRAALAARTEFDVPSAAPSMGFSLVWLDEAFENPVDARTYVAEGGFHKYSPEERVPRNPSSVVQLGGVTLLNSEQELEGRVDARALADFLTRIADALADLVGGPEGAAFDVHVQLDLAPGQVPTLGVRVQPDAASPVDAPALLRAVDAHTAPPVTGRVRLVTRYAIRGGTLPPR
jgi:hypothetical protein